MKTVASIQKEIKSYEDEIIERGKERGDKKAIAAIKRAKKKLIVIKECLAYIKTNPSKDFIEKEKIRLQNRINAFMELYTPLDPEKFTKTDISKHRKAYEKKVDVPKTHKHLTVMVYLLK